MDLDLTEEQQLLSETVSRLMDKHYDAVNRLELLNSERGWSRDLWQEYANLGLLEVYGDSDGDGLGSDELLIVMESIGRALALEPYFSSIVLGARLVSTGGTAEQKAAILPQVSAGELLLGFAAAEASSRWSVDKIETVATFGTDGYRLHGQKIAVLGGDTANMFVVTALTDEGVGLFLVDAKDVECQCYAMHDGIRGGDVLLADSPARLLGASRNALAVIESAIDLALVALCAEAVGAMTRMLWITIEYLKSREQFGRTLATFQALQFRATEMYVALEQSRSMLMLARHSLKESEPDVRRQIVSASKVHIDATARLMAQESIQLHGGIGMTMENLIGHYAKRVTMISKTFAEPGELIAGIASRGGLITLKN